MTDRRYSDEEISAIFSKAVEGSQSLPQRSARDDGLTLAELQRIGRDVGIAPDAIAHAARSLDAAAAARPRRLLGLPIGVERSITLGRWLNEAEWEQLVVRLREVFDARGNVSAHGNFRQWTNGNLQALLEPTPTGHRLRLRTTKSSARAGVSVGLAAIGMSAVMAIASAVGGHLGAAMPSIASLVLTGGGILGFAAVPVPRWARLRARQMEAIIATLEEAEPARADRGELISD